MRCVPVSSFSAAFLSSWIRANNGLILSTSASEGRASHVVNFVKVWLASNGASPYLPDSEDFLSLM
jgi:hypothetical protein